MAFTPAIRASLLLDAKNGASSIIRRWSIRDLLDFNRNDNTSKVENTKFMLQEIQTRLAIQHDKLSLFSKSIEDYTKVAKIEGERVQRDLNNLLQLHQNTYTLTHQIMNGDGQALLENFTPPNQRYVVEVFDQIMSRHGTSVETLADACIHGRNMEAELPTIFRKQFLEVDLLRDDYIKSFLHSRLLIQLLCEHYISMNKKGKITGAVSLNADVVDGELLFVCLCVHKMYFALKLSF